MNNQLTELLTNYGEIGAIWFDGWWDQDQNPDFDWHLPEQYALIHRLQPACLMGNNHHQTPFEGEDIQIFERDLPTMNGMWGYKITDQNYKSPKTLIHYLVKAAGRDANLLLNIGPQPDGELPAVALERLEQVGKWMQVYGETIYGTRGGCIAPHPWGVTTQKDGKLYVHILDLQDKSLFLPLEGVRVKRAVDFVTRHPVKMQKCKDGILIQLEEVPTDIDKVVELEIS